MSRETSTSTPKHRRILLLASSIPVASCIFAFSLGPSPQKVLQNFYADQPAEDMMMDPLILAGDEIVPIVLTEIVRRDMPKRRYAIQFLGNGGYRGALPVLEAILNDETEEEYVRSDALHSILRIDRGRGLKLASLLQARSDLLGSSARAMGSRIAPEPPRRSYLEALTRHHD